MVMHGTEAPVNDLMFVKQLDSGPLSKATFFRSFHHENWHRTISEVSWLTSPKNAPCERYPHALVMIEQQ